MSKKTIFVLILLVSLLCSYALAENTFVFKKYELSIEIQENRHSKEMVNAIIYNSGKTPIESSGLTLPEDISQFTISDEKGKLKSNIIEINKTKKVAFFFTEPIQPGNSRRITFSFNTKSFIDELNETIIFSTRYYASKYIENFKLVVKLPEGYILPINSMQSDQTTFIMFPKADISTDGRKLIVSWVRTNFHPGKSFEAFLKFEKAKVQVKPEVIIKPIPVEKEVFKVKKELNVFMAITIFFTALIIGFILGYVLNLRNNKNKLGISLKLLSKLTEDERKILNLLLRRDNKMSQVDLNKELDFSKSKITRLLQSMEHKKILEVNREDKVNKIMLSEYFKSKTQE